MSQTATLFGQALGEYLGLIHDPAATLAAAVQADPEFIIGHTTLAALNSLGGVPGDAAAVREPLAAATALAGKANRREKLHIAAANAWATDDIAGAAALWEEALQDDPADILSLRLAHDTHFFLGASQKLRDLPVSALHAYAPGSRERGFVLGMASFGLEETGEYAEAEKAGREAAEINPADTWGVHAVAHVLEMQGRAKDGITWLRGLEPHWAPANGLAVHQWWHLALYLIEESQLDEALALYDAHIHAPPGSIVLDLVDAAALLWRLELLGVDVGARWQELAPFWGAHAEEHVLAFNDVHISFTFTGTGDEAAADRLESSIAAYAARETGTNAEVSKILGLPVIAALRAFRKGDYAGTVARLKPHYKQLAPIGGSNAQRDLLIQTLGISAYKIGDLELAREIAAERRKLKAGSPRSWAAYPALLA
ncbi:MAG: tetratricopeptide repeat protein [Acidocella sp.]|uniref:tetratricopeptide repeat protein n=1 Tax=Acidocella sp. TaxID=50710 RepID=UPI003FBB7B46